jgi:hypothetical protein
LGYAVYNQDGQRLGTVQEVLRGRGPIINVKLPGSTGSKRMLRFRVVDMQDQVLLEMTRPKVGWLEMKAKLVIEGPGGSPIGEIEHEAFGVAGQVATAAHAGISVAPSIARVGLGGLKGMKGMAARTSLGAITPLVGSAVGGLDKVGHARFGLNAGGERIGSIHAESATQWDFHVLDPAGNEVARISKTWAGWAKERFTKADNYVVEMHSPLDEPLRSLVIAAALAIDVELKQFGDQTKGSSVRGTRRYK